MTEQKKIQLRDNILNLAMTCPVEHCNPEDCPLFKVRRLELSRRLEWFRDLSDDDLVYLNAYHFACMKTRLAARMVEICH
jgi:hypothetical protein